MIKNDILTIFDINKSKWTVKEKGKRKVIQLFSTPQQAQFYGQQIAKENKRKHFFHNIDGTIVLLNDYTEK